MSQSIEPSATSVASSRDFSTSDDKPHQSEAGDAKLASPSAGLGGLDIEAVLQTIVGSIADSERRQSNMLRSMENRLALLGHETTSVRSRVPGAYAPAFARIEEGMSILAERIAQSTGETGRTAAVAYPPIDMRYGAPRMKPADHNRLMSSAATPPQPARPAEASIAGDTFNPWDRDSAAALTGLYESGEAHIINNADAYQDESASLIVANARGDQGHPLASASVRANVDHSWFERRFVQISDHIEKALFKAGSDDGVKSLGRRFDQFEERFETTLENVLERGDFAGLRGIEEGIGELVLHLESSQSKLSRIDVIEQQIGEMVDHLRDAAAEGGGRPAPLHASMIDDIAEKVSQALSAKLANVRPGGDAAANFEDLYAILDQLLTQSRQGEENTNVLLDTLQQAMIRLLDRVDAIEMSVQRPGFSPEPDRKSSKPTAAVAAAPEREPDVSTLESVRSAAVGHAVAAVAAATPRPSDRNFDDTPSFEEAYPSSRRRNPRAERSDPAPIESTAEAVDALRPSQSQPAYNDAIEERSTAQRNRQDYIAEARRARSKLAQAAPDTTGGNAKSPEVVLDANDRESIAALAAASGSPATGARRLVVAMLAAFLTLGAGGLWFAVPGSNTEPRSDRLTASTQSLPMQTADHDARGDASSTDVLNANSNEAARSQGSAGEPMDGAAHANDDAVQNDNSTVSGEIGTAPVEPNNLSTPISPAISPSTVSLSGIALDEQDSTSTGEGVANAQRTRAIAKMSNSLGAKAAKEEATFSLPDLSSAVDESEAGEQPVASQVSAVVSEDGNSSIEMPPATVGPVSLRMAASKGDPSAAFEVGARFAEGRGITQNFSEAARWYQRAASKGFAQAQYRIGTLYERGLGVSADIPRARVWYEQAAEQGNVKAMHNLAVLSANPPGGSPDYANASRWFKLAAGFGLADSQFNLAVLYENGLGVDKDMKQAYKWLSLAANSGDKEATRRRDILRGKLDGRELADAEALVKSWRAKGTDRLINDPRVAGEAWKQSSGTTASISRPTAPVTAQDF